MHAWVDVDVHAAGLLSHGLLGDANALASSWVLLEIFDIC